MSRWDVVLPLVTLAIGVALTMLVVRRRRSTGAPASAKAKILFPFVGTELSERALQATLRLARAEQAVVVPAYLARVPLPLTLDAPVGRECEQAFALFEVIEQRAAALGVPVDGRIARGRSARHALRRLIAEVPAATRIVVAAASDAGADGFSIDDIAWLLRNAREEVLVVRPSPSAGVVHAGRGKDDRPSRAGPAASAAAAP